MRSNSVVCEPPGPLYLIIVTPIDRYPSLQGTRTSYRETALLRILRNAQNCRTWELKEQPSQSSPLGGLSTNVLWLWSPDFGARSIAHWYIACLMCEKPWVLFPVPFWGGEPCFSGSIFLPSACPESHLHTILLYVICSCFFCLQVFLGHRLDWGKPAGGILMPLELAL